MGDGHVARPNCCAGAQTGGGPRRPLGRRAGTASPSTASVRRNSGSCRPLRRDGRHGLTGGAPADPYAQPGPGALHGRMILQCMVWVETWTWIRHAHGTVSQSLCKPFHSIDIPCNCFHCFLLTSELWQSSNRHRNSRRISLLEVDRVANYADNWCVLDQIVHLPPDPVAGDGGRLNSKTWENKNEVY